ncbi:MAG: hypothetical protein ACFFD8_06860 [Candidatus Thorarchaeota archaeon]
MKTKLWALLLLTVFMSAGFYFGAQAIACPMNYFQGESSVATPRISSFINQPFIPDSDPSFGILSTDQACLIINCLMDGHIRAIVLALVILLVLLIVIALTMTSLPRN